MTERASGGALLAQVRQASKARTEAPGNLPVQMIRINVQCLDATLERRPGTNMTSMQVATSLAHADANERISNQGKLGKSLICACEANP